MSINKLTVLTVAGLTAVLSTSVLAANHMSNMGESAGVYVEGNVGYASHDWKEIAQDSTGLSLINLINSGSATSYDSFNSKDSGGVTFNVDLGYQFNQYFSLEGGWYYLPEAKINVQDKDGTGNVLDSDTVKLDTWALYGALKGQLPIYENTFLFMKAGLTYTKYQSKDVDNSDESFVSPMFATGVQYYFNENMSVSAQYTYLAGEHKTDKRAPDANIFTVGVGYKFAM